MKSKLSAKQLRFVHEYLKDANGTQAAVRAGYSPRTAQEQASRLIKNPGVREIVCEKMDEAARKAEIDTEWILRELKSNYELAIADRRFNHAIQILSMIERHLVLRRSDKISDNNVTLIVETGLGPFTPGSAIPDSPNYPDFIEKVKRIRCLHEETKHIAIPLDEQEGDLIK